MNFLNYHDNLIQAYYFTNKIQQISQITSNVFMQLKIKISNNSMNLIMSIYIYIIVI